MTASLRRSARLFRIGRAADLLVHLSEANADKWLPLLYQVSAAKNGTERPVGPSIADGYEAVGMLTQHQKRFNDDEVAEIVTGYRAGATILELAARHACDRKTVIHHLKLHCVEIRHRCMDRAKIDEAVHLYESGLSLIKVGKRVGADPKTVKARLAERGVPLRNQARMDS
jgi:hypothetical protein